MTDPKFQPGSLVRDNHSRVGKVVGSPLRVEIDSKPVEVVTVDFWGAEVKRPENWLNLLASDSPEALLVDSPEALVPWAEEAPLKLVALALSVGGGSGKVAEIRAKLDGRVLETGKWENWWKKQPPQMRKHPEYFKVAKVGRDSEYSLLSYYDSVPVTSALRSASAKDRKGATSADWGKWLQSDAHDLAPGRFPPKAAVDALAKWPGRDIDRVLDNAVRGAKRFLASEKRPPKQAAGAWMDAVSQAAARRRELDSSQSVATLDSQTSQLLAQLAHIAGRDNMVRVLADAFVAPEGYAEELEELRQSLSDAQTCHARELENRQQSHAAEMESLRQSHAAELTELRQAQDAELQRERQEQERLRQQVRERNAELAANREESRLEVRQDMLLAVGEVMRSVFRQNGSGELAGDVAAGLALALRAGRAEPLGIPGEAVEFDPELHQPERGVPDRGQVRVVAPGVIYRGGIHGDRVLLKAQVKHEAD